MSECKRRWYRHIQEARRPKQISLETKMQIRDGVAGSTESDELVSTLVGTSEVQGWFSRTLRDYNPLEKDKTLTSIKIFSTTQRASNRTETYRHPFCTKSSF
jgi:hypothetical protein